MGFTRFLRRSAITSVGLCMVVFVGQHISQVVTTTDDASVDGVTLAQVQERMANDLSSWIAVRAAEPSDTKLKTPRDGKKLFKKFGDLDKLIRKYGLARVVVRYKDKAPKIPPPGMGTRANYWFWKQVGWPTAAPPRQVGKSDFVRRDVDEAQLKALNNDPKIDLVLPDIPIPPALSKSGPLVRPDLDQMRQAAARPERQAYAAVVLDSGIEADHPFLVNAVLTDFDACFSSEHLVEPYRAESLCPDGHLELKVPGAGKPCPATIEHCDHGTHVAGIMAGWGGSVGGKKLSGVAPAVPIVSIQIYSKFNSDSFCEDMGSKAPCIAAFISDQISALEYVKELKGKGLPIGAVNMSLAMPPITGSCDTHSFAAGIARRVSDLRALNIPVVMAAGNDGALNSVAIPGCIEGAVTVAASDNEGKLAVRYPDGNGGSNFSELVDVAAPGVRIMSSVPGKAFAEKNGTSMAAPHVAGLLAKIRNERPSAGVDEQVRLLIGASTSTVEHPTTQLKRKIAFYGAATFVPTGVAVPSSSLGSSTTPQQPSTAASGSRGAAFLVSQSNRLLLDFGAKDPTKAKKRILDLLQKKGIPVIEMQDKTGQLGIVITKDPIDQGVLEALRKEANIKGVYIDVPIAPAR